MAIDFTRDDWKRICRTYDAWWSGELDRPLINISITGRDPGRDEPELPAHTYAASYSMDTPAEQIVDRWDWDLSCRQYPGDAFPHTWLNLGAGVMAAFMGARLVPEEHTVWFYPAEHREITDIRFEYQPENPWLARVKDLAREAMRRWNGLVQVGNADLGGNLDILQIFRPSEKLLLDLYDHPDQVKRLTWEAHELWFRYFREINEVLQPANPGYSCWTPIFSTRPYYMLQCDFSYMISPEMFAEFVAPELEATAKRLDNPFYHMDGPGQLAHLDQLLEIENLKGIQWVPGAGAGDCTKWPDVFGKIHDAEKLIQIIPNGADPIDGLDAVVEQLGDARGLFVHAEMGPKYKPKLTEALKRYGAM